VVVGGKEGDDSKKRRKEREKIPTTAATAGEPGPKVLGEEKERLSKINKEKGTKK